MTIVGDHLEGFNDTHVLYVESKGVTMRFLPSSILRKLQNLRGLKFENVKLSKLSKKSFESCNKLQTIRFTRNEISGISENVFGNCGENLRYVDLSSNGIRSVDNEAFVGLENL
jgi:Leucine-rich repeat (LRR) protein